MKKHLISIALLCAGLLAFLSPAAIAQAAPTPPTAPDYSLPANVGQSVSWTANVTAGTAPFTYQWAKNGTAIPGATAASYQIPSAQPTDAGKYSVVVSNSAGSAASNNCTLSVNPVPPSGASTTAVVK